MLGSVTVDCSFSSSLGGSSFAGVALLEPKRKVPATAGLSLDVFDSLLLLAVSAINTSIILGRSLTYNY